MLMKEIAPKRHHGWPYCEVHQKNQLGQFIKTNPIWRLALPIAGQVLFPMVSPLCSHGGKLKE